MNSRKARFNIFDLFIILSILIIIANSIFQVISVNRFEEPFNSGISSGDVKNVSTADNSKVR